MDEAELKERLQSKRTEERIEAVKQLIKSELSDKQALLLKALEDRSTYVASLAAEALGEGTDDNALSAMIARFEYLSADGVKRDPGCQIRANLAFAFGRLECHFASDVLNVGIRTHQIEAGDDTAGALRGNCALALGALRNPDSVRALALLLFARGDAAQRGLPGDPRANVEPRKSAARALSLLGSVQGRLPLTLRLAHPENEVPEVLQECMRALVELEDPQVVEVLQPFLESRDEALAAYTALMIAQTRAPEAVGLLGATIDRLRGDPLRAVVLALSTLRTPEADEKMRAFLKSGREAVRLAVIETLTVDAVTKPILERLAANDPSPQVRLAAYHALRAA
ncbi:MAG: hypothetical protein M3Y28_02605 [Armatimonadota bacterium]|nr:hypothetical protein [Armatimonadota bacterium]